MSPFNIFFMDALKDCVLHDKKGETHTFMGQPMCTARPFADLHYDPVVNGERPQQLPSYM